MDPRRQAFLTAIRSVWGLPYLWGGKHPSQGGLDCSGLLTWAAREAGLDLGDPNWTNAEGLKAHCEQIDGDLWEPGDLILFEQTYEAAPGYATHCGALVRDGNWMWDAHGDPWPGVGETDLRQTYWQSKMLGVWRPRMFLDVGIEPVPAPPAEDELARERAYSGGLLTILGHVEAALRESVHALDSGLRARGKRGAWGHVEYGRQRAHDAWQEVLRHQPEEGWPE